MIFNTASSPGIYMIKNITNGKFYIGKSKNASNRLSNHMKHLNAGCHKVINMQRDYNNGDHFVKGVITHCSFMNLHKNEVLYIEKYKAINNGYNKELPVEVIYESTYTGRLLIYNGETNELIATVKDVKSAAILMKIAASSIDRCVNKTSASKFKNRLYEFIILKESQDIKEFLIEENKRLDIITNGLDEETRLKSWKKNLLKAVESTRKRVGMFDLDGNLLEEFTHANAACIKYPDFKYKGIVKAISGERKKYKELLWKYI